MLELKLPEPVVQSIALLRVVLRGCVGCHGPDARILPRLSRCSLPFAGT
jgi:hypothetical protein